MVNAESRPVRVIHLLSIGNYEILRESFPFFEISETSLYEKNSGAVSDWTFYSVAAVGGLILGSQEKYDGEHRITKEDLREVDPAVLDIAKDLINFIGQTETQDYKHLKAKVGLWFLWNVTSQKPSAEYVAGPGDALGGAFLEIAGYSNNVN